MSIFEPRWECPRCCWIGSGRGRGPWASAAPGGAAAGLGASTSGDLSEGHNHQQAEESAVLCGAGSDPNLSRHIIPSAKLPEEEFPFGRSIPFKDIGNLAIRMAAAAGTGGTDTLHLPPCHSCHREGLITCSMSNHLTGGEGQLLMDWQVAGAAVPDGWQVGQRTRATDQTGYKVRPEAHESKT